MKCKASNKSAEAISESEHGNSLMKGEQEIKIDIYDSV
jgi:hypothetical protein